MHNMNLKYIVTYTEGNKMGIGNVLSLCCYNKSPKSPTQTIPILNVISNLSWAYKHKWD